MRQRPYFVSPLKIFQKDIYTGDLNITLFGHLEIETIGILVCTAESLS